VRNLQTRRPRPLDCNGRPRASQRGNRGPRERSLSREPSGLSCFDAADILVNCDLACARWTGGQIGGSRLPWRSYNMRCCVACGVRSSPNCRLTWDVVTSSCLTTLESCGDRTEPGMNASNGGGDLLVLTTTVIASWRCSRTSYCSWRCKTAAATLPVCQSSPEIIIRWAELGACRFRHTVDSSVE